MVIEICNSYQDSSLKARKIVIEYLRQHKTSLLCAATGGSPTRLYELLAEESEANPELFAELRLIKLDEWGGIPMSQRGTCEDYLQQHLIGPLKLRKNFYISFESDSDNPAEECVRVQQMLEKNGPIDICILGLGTNGHIAFNEPASFLQPHAHVAQLSDESMQHTMISGEERKPTYGLTVGMADIMASKLILLLINGSHKKEITRLFLTKEITTHLPASFLWLHPNVICLIDKSAAG